MASNTQTVTKVVAKATTETFRLDTAAAPKVQTPKNAPNFQRDMRDNGVTLQQRKLVAQVNKAAYSAMVGTKTPAAQAVVKNALMTAVNRADVDVHRTKERAAAATCAKLAADAKANNPCPW
ncbi:MAG: hypothetical protein WDW38_006669 [Sanguina aurantia]